MDMDYMCHSSRDLSISGLDGHIKFIISGCSLVWNLPWMKIVLLQQEL